MKTFCLITSISAAFNLAVKITRFCRDRDRARIFRGWSRLCLHAASLSAAEGTLAATAAAGAPRADEIETEATAAAEKADAMKRAADASAEEATSGEQAQRRVVEMAWREAMDQVLRQQREHLAKTLVRCCAAAVYSFHNSSFVFSGNNNANASR